MAVMYLSLRIIRLTLNTISLKRRYEIDEYLFPNPDLNNVYLRKFKKQTNKITISNKTIRLKITRIF